MPEAGTKNKKRVSKGNIENLTSYILSLPVNDAGSKDELSVAEIFASTSDAILLHFVNAFEELINKKGYGFTEMAQIFMEKTGVFITPRQLKFHYLRNKTLKEKMPNLNESQNKTQSTIDKQETKPIENSSEDKTDKKDAAEDKAPDANISVPLPMLDSDDYPDYDQSSNAAEDKEIKTVSKSVKKNTEKNKEVKKKNVPKSTKPGKTFGENKPGSFLIDMEEKPI